MPESESVPGSAAAESRVPLDPRDFEEVLADGGVQIRPGHPRYCPRAVANCFDGEPPHEPHRFDYTYLAPDGATTTGHYECRGSWL